MGEGQGGSAAVGEICTGLSSDMGCGEGLEFGKGSRVGGVTKAAVALFLKILQIA